MKNIGQKIRELRIEKGMTQQELAERAGYKSRASINKIELERDIPINKVVLIANALGVSPSVLMGWEDDEDDFVARQNSQIMEYATKLMNMDEDDMKTVMKMIDTLSKK